MPPDTRFWTARKVAWYRRANERSDYAARVLDAIGPLVAGATSALDVGAGFGALALPLAARLRHVTAMEPAPAMAAALREEAARRGLANVEVVEAAWGEVDPGRHDLVVCAHVSPLLGRGAAFLRAAPRYATRGVALVRDRAGGDDKFFFGELYPILRGEPYAHGCDWEETAAELRGLGIHPTVTMIEYSSDQPFTDIEEACDFWLDYLRLDEHDDRRAWLRDFLLARLVRTETGWVAPFRKRAVVLHWETQP